MRRSPASSTARSRARARLVLRPRDAGGDAEHTAQAGVDGSSLHASTDHLWINHADALGPPPSGGAAGGPSWSSTSIRRSGIAANRASLVRKALAPASSAVASCTASGVRNV